MESARDPLQTFVVIFILVTGTIYLFWISWSTKAVNNQHIGDIKIFFISGLTGIIGYYIGSSRGSRSKTETINQLISPKDGSTVITTKSPDPVVVDARLTKEARVKVLEALANPTPEEFAELNTLRAELLT
jgi:hypothetical protein